ncbi:MAG TPA: Jag N-terminal domain-containing protein, partial [Clostridiales bacterium]|nr:Jag N-terminal domain-containing protein [Clostridiales bacterium]
MIKEAVATGVTIEEAQEAALAALGAPMSADIQFEVLTMPEKKKFGLFGGKLAEVRAYYECPDAPKKKPAAP